MHELVDRHKIVHAWEHRPGSGEVGIDGRQAGEFSLEEAIHHSFRFNLARQIVGEVRGPEVWNMLKAMESGPGSISTTHARSAVHTIEKLVSCAMEKGPQVTREPGHQQAWPPRSTS
ncbi:Flp pilus assembly complex ATPase component TadA [Nocardioides sp. W3-2-3]|uniref:ATPase, T2SS/T4P/T4SS family n=1 Tax=Nocardioides convexus TaxID=2712224 RepID=UPI00241818FD|nr:ATPase, T2SS/T4P/T4SS family [Nocardioides convexus]NHA01188.1 Flp pilus assembly complex ATPase component TadA [Nocardioides convexus]